MEIQDLMYDIRENAIKRMDKKSPADLSASWSSEDLLYSGKGNAVFVILPTPGCAHALSESGGCTMCSYIADSPLEKVSSSELIDIFKKLMERHDIQPKTAVKIFVSGSFLNEEELPKEARDEILKILNKNDNIEEVVVESRPEFVSENVLKDCCNLLQDKIFEVSIGLESGSDYIKKYKINKGFLNKDFEIAINIIKKMKNDYKITSKAYLFVKPVLTSEKEAIDDAVASAKYAEEVGVDRISFCPATIHKGTLMELLWRRGSYKPPWIWSIIEIIKKVRSEVKIPVIMDTSGFGTRRGPFNCKKCNKKFKNMIIESNLNQSIPEEIECECRNRWRGDVEFSDLTRSTTCIK
ncbi:MAG: archaeosine biosynthesis radical SAM protein RaSEA [Methanobacterium sp.]|uniref:archaeosine biosynthesis radical SAM protein RaSEA n=1 Tax=Methanobacterium sp. TaxID=2164 RepID=UPI003D64D422|nr:archaeosine biosynthesis radical SAM protein RaSEA [Methanobacterium sp.]